MSKSKNLKKYTLLIFAFCFSVLLSGCSVLSRKEAGPQLPTKVITVKSPKDLSDGYCYVEHKIDNGEHTEYYQLYKYYSNFSDATSTSSSDVLWYLNDYEAIPTMYAGDRLVLRQGNTLPDSFEVSRFMDLGFTFGFASLKENKYGNYYIDTSDSEDVLLASNAGKLLRMNEPQTVLYSVGNEENSAIIRAGNVAPGGVIANLERNGTFLCTFYTGTYKQEVSLKADTAAFSRYETVSTRDMSYIDNDLVEIRFPENFNSGYYSINGSGLVRYVNGADYNDSTDFNIPNDVEDEVEEYDLEEEDDGIDPNDESQYDNDEEEEKKEVYLLTVSEEKPVTITVTYDDPVTEDEELEDPTVQIIGEDYASYVDKNDGENKFETVLTLPIGRYRVEVTGLEGRKSYFSASK